METKRLENRFLDNGYDVPWEFLRRQTTGSSCNNVTSLAAVDGWNNENGIRHSRASDQAAPFKTPLGNSVAAQSESSSNNGDEIADTKRRSKPVIAAKPMRNSSVNTESGPKAGSFSPCTVKKMPGGSLNGVTVATPPCGIRAQQIRKGKYSHGPATPVGTVSGGSNSKTEAENVDNMKNCVVWEYRKPEHDARPSCEYDAPWDSKRISGVPSSSGGTDGGVQQPTADSEIVYDEPWDTKRDGSRIVFGVKLRPSVRELKDDGTKDAFGSGLNNDRRSSECTASPDGLSPALVNGQGNVAAIESSNLDSDSKQTISTKPSTGSSKQQIRLETAFCSNPRLSTGYLSKNRYQDKDRLIQRLANDDLDVLPPSDPRTSANHRRSAEFRWKDGQAVGDSTSTPAPVSNGDCDRDPGQDTQIDQLPSYDIPWEFSKALKSLRTNHAVVQRPLEQSGVTKKEETKSKPNRQQLSLNFGCAALNPTSAKIDASLPLNEQLWYHGNVTRAEAEQRLSTASEGSFLVRVCETSSRQGDEFALSLKSARGFMHMKIQQDPQRNWILGYFSQPFESIPIMIRYYSSNKLPIKGAEHMRLLRPVVDQVL